MRTMLRGLVLLWTASLLLSGCGMNGYKDIDKRFFVVSMGVDPGEKKNTYKVWMKFAIPSGEMKAGQEKSELHSEEAETIGEAVRKMKTRVDKEIDFGHLKMIVLGKGVISRPLEETIDWFLRRRDIQKIAWVAVGQPDAKSVLGIKTKSERVPSNSLFLSFGYEGIESPSTVTVQLFDLHRRLEERGLDPLLPVLTAMEEASQQAVRQTVVFNKEEKQVWLNAEESEMLNLIMGATEKGTWGIEKEGLHFLFSAERMTASYKITRKADGRPVIVINGKIRGIVEEMKGGEETHDANKLKKIITERLNKDISKLLYKLRDQRVDPIGFGLRYRSRNFTNKTEWENWHKLYSEIEFETKVKVELEGVGLIK
ncbi:Ger(x)C family spore germination protein [Paenibacillus turpanensis]|uniref:Ger(x)C family spore germination protein n=1 Tax=Paenibacillus turpanensis TaxID=2689078 RepID=UPI00140B887E|nr:Ger(x)C family spore germination protein [Paenibacillus turpanensis]